MGAIIQFSLCLSDIKDVPQAVTKGKNGKAYLAVTASVNDETKYGNNVGVYLTQNKEDRENKVPRKYLGNGKVVWVADSGIRVAEKEQKEEEAVEKKEDDFEFPF